MRTICHHTECTSNGGSMIYLTNEFYPSYTFQHVQIHAPKRKANMAIAFQEAIPILLFRYRSFAGMASVIFMELNRGRRPVTDCA